jgi:UDP-N-acetylmuramoylalanine--D-glutamate ligase
MYVRFSELDAAAVGVWGAGREIRSLASQLTRRLPGARITVAAFDDAPPPDVGEALGFPAARVVSANEAVRALGDCDVVVRSPGVSIHRPELHALLEAGVPLTTATSLWLAEREGRRVIGITGSKGKSTTAALAFHLARAAGRTTHLAGNIGLPALDLLDQSPTDLAIVELSSYQIADLQIGPEVALVTSLFREHSDWHGSEEAYRAEKLRILGLPGVRAIVLGGRDERLVEEAEAAAGGVTQATRYGVQDGWDVTPLGVTLRGELRVPSAALPLPGEHNALNLCGALAALEAAGVAPPALPAALDGFEALPHRLETVAEHAGVQWVNDSISTTPESTLAALASFRDREVVLIAGGQDRGQDYAELGAVLARIGATVIGIPTTGARLLAAARAAGVAQERAIEASDIDVAVGRARALAPPGAVILLSPAAPSYDRFRDFEARGERFRALAGRAAR